MSSDLLSTLNTNGSGINLRQLAQTLASAETTPRLVALQNKVETDSVRLSALSQIRGQFDKLGGVLAEAASNPVLTVTTSSQALMPRVTNRDLLTQGTVPLEVQSLATRQVLEFAGFSAANSTVETGSLTIDFGQWNDAEPQAFTAGTTREPVTLTVPPGTTLEELAALLSETEGVTARVLNKGDGSFSLGIVGETGAVNGIRLTASNGSGDGDIVLSDLDTTATNAARQVQAATDARLLVDGIAITRSDNVVSDILPGMEITLSAVISGSLVIERDRFVAQENLEKLIGGLNETLSLMKSLTQRGIGEETSGTLSGDRTVESLEQGLRRLISTPIAGFDERPISLADLGIATQRDGLLRFDPPAFDRTFAQRAQDFDALFTNSLRGMTEGVAVSGSPRADMKAGSYSFVLDAQGNAILDGSRMLSLDLGDGRLAHFPQTGPLQGLRLTTEAGLTSGTFSFGRSFADSLTQLLGEAGTSTGLLGRREAEISKLSDDATGQIETLEARAALLEKRYLTKFAAMEQVVTQMKSTGNYLESLVESWSKG
ncbi:flagellar filament capping protein FliD [Seohaeicola saemankumensis]|uniref:flagellar filament capping protein FliD n=1 Tax=Seohaeicola saemankumensis TaxID=481181 RepID=UPI001E47A438|nr:flagellar filament capping protein FliD [Seohaeicola saemankumensis]MCD1625096.1 flagellar filament capping protein FliD [Seohaeicola saemankumensis]